jgi:glycosyltransferase involved in cell wall biosynthesis
MLAKGFGGAERSFVDLCEALADRGHKVQAVCHKKFVQFERLANYPGIETKGLTVLGSWDRLAMRTLGRALAEFSPQIVQAHLARGAYLAGLACRRLGTPLLVKTHNYVNLKYYRDVDLLVPTTADQAGYLREAGIPAERLVVIPNFSRLAPGEPRQPARDRPLRFVSFGRLVHKKGFDLLLQAAQLLRSQDRVFHLTIGGAGPEQAVLKRMSEKLALSDCVEFTGWIDDVAALLDAYDVFVLPSRDEPFGIAVLEAMARGKAIIATRTQGPVEILDAATGVLVTADSPASIGEAMEGFIDEPERCATLGAAAVRRYQERYWDQAVVPQYEAAYQSLLKA